MRVAIVDGLLTLFYDGSRPLYNDELDGKWTLFCCAGGPNRPQFNVTDECMRYIKERMSWQQIIIVDGVTEIPSQTFSGCKNIERVIFADTVIRIEWKAFYFCRNLKRIKLSINMELIGRCTFGYCNLYSVFIPPSCRYIGEEAFRDNKDLTILNVPQIIELGNGIVSSTKLVRKSGLPWSNYTALNAWLKIINNDDQFALHKVCSSFHPTLDMILHTLKDKGGPKAFKVKNIIGITPSQYLEANPYANVNEKDIMKRYILEMIGEL